MQAAVSEAHVDGILKERILEDPKVVAEHGEAFGKAGREGWGRGVLNTQIYRTQMMGVFSSDQGSFKSQGKYPVVLRSTQTENQNDI